jgi:alkylation response protein AidB-like acyl-CoA dehydrogenase
LGLNSSSTADLVIEGAEVGRDRLLHDEGKGFTVAMATLDGGRIGIAAQALGIAQAAYDTAREYALERRQFGKRIADFQAIQWKLADMATEIDAARLLVYRAAWLKQEGRPHTEEGAKAKLFASEMARRQTAEAIQVLGGYGYTKEFPTERYYRDAKITEIYEDERDPAARHRPLDPWPPEPGAGAGMSGRMLLMFTRDTLGPTAPTRQQRICETIACP